MLGNKILRICTPVKTCKDLRPSTHNNMNELPKADVKIYK